MTKPKTDGFLARFFRWLVSGTLTLIVVAGAVAAVMFGAAALAKRSTDVPKPRGGRNHQGGG